MLLLMLTTEEAAHRARKALAPDEGLFPRMAEGDTGALEALYAQTKSAVYGFALSILKNAQDAEDVMQETFIILYSKAGSYRPQGTPMAWILTITRNLALMKLRKGGREAGPPGEEAIVTHPFEGTSLDKMVLGAALTLLSDEERQIVMLHCVSGLKHREIAGMLGLPLGTVLSKYRRALAKLQKYLMEEAS